MRWLSIPVLAALLIPLVLSILVSFTPSRYLELPRGAWTLQWYREISRDPVWTEALGNSLLVAGITAFFALPSATAAAFGLLRARFRWKAACENALLLPMILPTVALAAGMLVAVRQTPLWGSHVALALGHSVLAIPVAYLVMRASLRQVDPNLEAAARGLGASSWQAFRFVTLPLITPSVLAGALFATVISLNEVTLTLFLATRDTQTLPRVIWPNLRFAVTPKTAAASVVLLILTLPALIGAAWWLRPRVRNR